MSDMPMRLEAGIRISRRRFGAIAGAFSSLALVEACGLGPPPVAAALDGRITVRPKAGTKTTAHGAERLGLSTGRDAILQVPANATGAIPLIVMLHGAGGSAERFIRRFGAAGEAAGVGLLVPESRGSSWDAIRGRFGADVDFLNRALTRVFETVAVDPERLAIGGFSDGATYALSLGLINGDLFGRIVAFSPGFVVDGAPHGKPKIFVSHGTSDSILPIDRCSRVIVPDLQRRGYDVTFREFDGEHDMPAPVVAEGIGWVK